MMTEPLVEISRSQNMSKDATRGGPLGCSGSGTRVSGEWFDCPLFTRFDSLGTPNSGPGCRASAPDDHVMSERPYGGLDYQTSSKIPPYDGDGTHMNRSCDQRTV